MATGLYVKEIVRVAKTYKIKTFVLMRTDAKSDSIEQQQALGHIVELLDGNEFQDEYQLAKAITRTGAYRFPSHNEADVIHGQGTVALELEDEVSKLLEADLPSQDHDTTVRKGKLDAIVHAMGNGSTLSGICMAAQGTGMRVFGAELISSSPDCDPDGIREGAGDYWGSFQPMGALPWSIFTSPRMLSAVYYVDQRMATLASSKLCNQHGIEVRPYDAAPLGLVLYSDDFSQFAEKEAELARVRNIGIIVRSDSTKSKEDLAEIGCTYTDAADLERSFKECFV